MKKSNLLLLFLLCAVTTLPGQSVSINTTGSAPDSSAMLDIQSTAKGILIPRMDSVQRQAIYNPAEGLLVFDMDTRSFWFRQNGQWTELAAKGGAITDADQDTKIVVEQSPDDDTLRLYAGGMEFAKTGGNTFELGSPGGSIYMGRGAAPNADSLLESNIAFGIRAAENITSGEMNLFIGRDAGSNVTTGYRLFAIGDSALLQAEGSHRTMAIGHAAGMLAQGTGCQYLGYAAGKFSNGTNSLHVGRQAGLYDSGDRNTIIGHFAADDSLSGNYNTVLGYSAGTMLTEGSFNTMIGYYAGFQHSTGSSNVFLGSSSGRSNQSGSANAFVGVGSGYDNTFGSYNVFMGNSAGANNTEGVGNTFVGYSSGRDNTTGGYNTFVGRSAGFGADSCDYNTFVGFSAGFDNESGNYNTFIGTAAGANNSTASYNTATGWNALAGNTTGQYNTALGIYAGQSTYTGNNNTFIGSYAGRNNNSGKENTYVGRSAGVGIFSLDTSASMNTFVGYYAALNIVSGEYNTVLGHRAGYSLDTGSTNTLIGASAGYLTTTGQANTYLGTSAGYYSNGSHNVFLGYRAGVNEESDNKLIIANDSTSFPLVYGDFSDDYFSVNGSLVVNGVAGELNPVSSLVTIYGPDNYLEGPTLTFRGDNGDQAESGRIRFIEGSAFNNFRGGFIHCDGSVNRFHIGIHNSSDNNAANDINAITIERPNGYIGIHENDPTEMLMLNDGSVFASNLGNNDSNQGFLLGESTTHPVFGFVYDGTGSGGENSAHIKQFIDDSVAVMTFKVSGQVGIGTTTPGESISNAKLDVANGHVITSNNYGYFARNSAGTGVGAGIDSESDDGLGLYAGGSKRLTIEPSGNFGVGTSSPDTKMEVETGGITRTRITSTGSSEVSLDFKRNSGSDWRIANSGGILYLGQSSDNLATVDNVLRLGGGSMTPAVDNTIVCGSSSLRWSTVYAVNGTIQTSDAQLKENVQSVDSGLDLVMQMRPVPLQLERPHDRQQEDTHGIPCTRCKRRAPRGGLRPRVGGRGRGFRKTMGRS